MKPYPLQLEISGPIALWARPDTMPNPVSYVAPTFSAVKGIFERSAGASPASFGASPNAMFSRWKSVIGGAGDPPAPVGDPRNGRAKAHESTRRVAGSNRRVACATHAFNYGGPLSASDWIPSPPRLGRGLSEVSSSASSDVGPFRNGTAPCATENHVIPAFLEMVFDQAANLSQN